MRSIGEYLAQSSDRHSIIAPAAAFPLIERLAREAEDLLPKDGPRIRLRVRQVSKDENAQARYDLDRRYIEVFITESWETNLLEKLLHELVHAYIDNVWPFTPVNGASIGDVALCLPGYPVYKKRKLLSKMDKYRLLIMSNHASWLWHEFRHHELCLLLTWHEHKLDWDEWDIRNFIEVGLHETINYLLFKKFYSNVELTMFPVEVAYRLAGAIPSTNTIEYLESIITSHNSFASALIAVSREYGAIVSEEVAITLAELTTLGVEAA